MGSVVGYVPYFGLLTDDGRKADWVVEIKTSTKARSAAPWFCHWHESHGRCSLYCGA